VRSNLIGCCNGAMSIGLQGAFHTEGIPPITSVMQSWVEHLLLSSSGGKKYTHDHHKNILANYPVPDNLEFVFCQHEACVLGKR
jgi:hypothetical protein